MGLHVVGCRIDIDGLHIRHVGTYSKGHYFPIESVPKELIQKALNKETAINDKKRRVPICTFLTPDGTYITVDKTYIPQFNIGKPPPVMPGTGKTAVVVANSQDSDDDEVVEPEIYETSKKPRVLEDKPEIKEKKFKKKVVVTGKNNE